MTQTNPSNLTQILTDLDAMRNCEPETEKQAEHAVRVINGVLCELGDQSLPFSVLASIISHITFFQPDRVAVLQWLIQLVMVGWQRTLDEQKTVALATAEKELGQTVH